MLAARGPEGGFAALVTREPPDPFPLAGAARDAFVAALEPEPGPFGGESFCASASSARAAVSFDSRPRRCGAAAVSVISPRLVDGEVSVAVVARAPPSAYMVRVMKACWPMR